MRVIQPTETYCQVKGYLLHKYGINVKSDQNYFICLYSKTNLSLIYSHELHATFWRYTGTLASKNNDSSCEKQDGCELKVK